MANLEITNNVTRGIVLWDPVFADAVLVDAAGDTYPAGTMLGRITANDKLTKFKAASVDGSEIPLAVLTEEVVLPAATDVAARPLISGRIRRGDLIAGDPARAPTQAEVDTLRDFSIISLSTQQLAELDNQ